MLKTNAFSSEMYLRHEPRVVAYMMSCYKFYSFVINSRKDNVLYRTLTQCLYKIAKVPVKRLAGTRHANDVRLFCVSVEISHKIAINHKRLCFIKICVCVYYVFVRYSCSHKRNAKCLSRST